MALSAERIAVGLKIQELRNAHAAKTPKGKRPTLQTVGAGTGLSTSYLSEVEAGLKELTASNARKIAQYFDVPVGDIICAIDAHPYSAIRVISENDQLADLLRKEINVEPQDVLKLLLRSRESEGERSPREIPRAVTTGAVFRLFRAIHSDGISEAGEDRLLEPLLSEALSLYQQTSGNYFADIEERAAAVRDTLDCPDSELTGALQAKLEQSYGYRVDTEKLGSDPTLASDLRWIFNSEDEPRTLYLNPGLRDDQRAFVLAYHLAYYEMELTTSDSDEVHAPATSCPERPSLESRVNHFHASYFAGALLIREQEIRQQMAAIWSADDWDAEEFAKVLGSYYATPETVLYRICEVGLPTAAAGPSRVNPSFCLMRLKSEPRPDGDDLYRMINVVNLTDVPIFQWRGQHYCRRWAPLMLLRELEAVQRRASERSDETEPEFVVRAQRSSFIEGVEGSEQEFFVIAVARRLSLGESNSAIAVAIPIDEQFEQHVSYWDSESIPHVKVNKTCERCHLKKGAEDTRLSDTKSCAQRADVPSSIYEQRTARQRRIYAIDEFLDRTKPVPVGGEPGKS